tara:strand:- start:208 stop:456 length:249 start_codon:yes stop_codon:yes gene_type:complete
VGYQRLVAVNHNFSALGSVRERDNSTQRFSEGMTGERNRRYGIVNVAISKVMYRTVVDTHNVAFPEIGESPVDLEAEFSDEF